MSETHDEPQEPQLAAAPEADPEMAVPSDDPDEAAALRAQLGERTADLQRLQAEYLNYKRRVDRDRQSVRDTAVAGTLTALLPVLDDLDRAREHGELDGGFKAVADSLERIVTTLGLERFGTPGEPFDPRIHEALTLEYATDVAGPTAAAILQPGYRIGERVVRPARVAVSEPEVAADAEGDAVDVPDPDGETDAEEQQSSATAADEG